MPHPGQGTVEEKENDEAPNTDSDHGQRHFRGRGMPNRWHDKAQRNEHPERRVKEIGVGALRAHFPGEHVIERKN